MVDPPDLTAAAAGLCHSFGGAADDRMALAAGTALLPAALPDLAPLLSLRTAALGESLPGCPAQPAVRRSRRSQANQRQLREAWIPTSSASIRSRACSATIRC